MSQFTFALELGLQRELELQNELKKYLNADVGRLVLMFLTRLFPEKVKSLDM